MSYLVRERQAELDLRNVSKATRQLLGDTSLVGSSISVASLLQRLDWEPHSSGTSSQSCAGDAEGVHDDRRCQLKKCVTSEAHDGRLQQIEIQCLEITGTRKIGCLARSGMILARALARDYALHPIPMEVMCTDHWKSITSSYLA
jgi:hypothetical protein